MKKGVTLIILAITIVILMILSGAIIMTMVDTPIFELTDKAIADMRKQEEYNIVMKEIIDIQIANKYLAIGDEFVEKLVNNLNKKYPDLEYKGEYAEEKSAIIITYTKDGEKKNLILDGEYVVGNLQQDDPIFTSIAVIGNPTNWVNTDVTLEVKPVLSSNVLREYSFDNGQNWQTENTKIYTENASNIVVWAKNEEGKTMGPVEININKIDKTAPSFTINKDVEYNADGSTKQVDTLILTLGDNVSVFKNMQVQDSQSGVLQKNIKCYKDGVEITDTKGLNQVGRYSVTYEAIDEIGNMSEINRDILVRWPVGGKYVLARQNVIGTGLGNESTGMGLYADDATTGKDASLPFASKYYYSGKTVDNYVSFPNTSSDKSSATTWRIINVAENDTIKIITNDVLNDDNYAMGDSAVTNRWKWNKTGLYSTLNSWVSSGIVGKSNEYNIDFSDNGHIEEGIFYVGTVDRRGTNESNSSTLQEVMDERTNTKAYLGDDTYTESEAKALLSWKSKLGLIMVTDVTKSSNSANVFSIRSTQTNQSAFKNTSWMYLGKKEWAINSSSDANQFWSLNIDQFLAFYTLNTVYKGYIRVTTYLKNNTILSGTGTSTDPFVIQENWGWFDPVATLNQ